MRTVLLSFAVVALLGTYLGNSVMSSARKQSQEEAASTRAELLGVLRTALDYQPQDGKARYPLTDEGEPYLLAARVQAFITAKVPSLAERGLKAHACTYAYTAGTSGASQTMPFAAGAFAEPAVRLWLLPTSVPDGPDCAAAQLEIPVAPNAVGLEFSRKELLLGNPGTPFRPAVGSLRFLQQLGSHGAVASGDTRMVLDTGETYSWNGTDTWTPSALPSFVRVSAVAAGQCAEGEVAITWGSALTGTTWCVMAKEAYVPELSRGPVGAAPGATGVVAGADNGLRADGKPARATLATWQEAMAWCESLAPNSRLVSLPVWKAMAEAAYNTASNWTGGAKGSGVLRQGLDGSQQADTPASVCEHDAATGAALCSGDSAQTVSPAHASRNRGLTVGSQVVYDLSGNAAEWVDPSGDRFLQSDKLSSLPTFAQASGTSYATANGYPAGTSVCAYGSPTSGYRCANTGTALPAALPATSIVPVNSDTTLLGLGVFGAGLEGHAAFSGAYAPTDKAMVLAGGGVVQAGSHLQLMRRPSARGVLHLDLIKALPDNEVRAGFRCMRTF